MAKQYKVEFLEEQEYSKNNQWVIKHISNNTAIDPIVVDELIRSINVIYLRNLIGGVAVRLPGVGSIQIVKSNDALVNFRFQNLITDSKTSTLSIGSVKADLNDACRKYIAFYGMLNGNMDAFIERFYKAYVKAISSSMAARGECVFGWIGFVHKSDKNTLTWYIPDPVLIALKNGDYASAMD